MRERRYRIHAAILIAALLMILSIPEAAALERTALDQVAQRIEHNLFSLKVNLREPVIRGGVMQAPTLTPKGWIHVDNAASVVLAAGTTVEVTGVFDYADRGFFIELAQEPRGMFGEPITRRARIRIRFMVGAPIDDPGAQAQEAIALIARVLSLPSNP